MLKPACTLYILTPKCDKYVIPLTILQPTIKQNGHGNKQKDHQEKQAITVVCNSTYSFDISIRVYV